MAEKNKQYEILDKILAETQRDGESARVWVRDPRHPDGGYYVQPAGDGQPAAGLSVDEIERYLRSS